MDKNKEQLKNLTTEFYQQIALEFDPTRKYQWVGWKKIFDFCRSRKFIPKGILDVACGNGRFVETAHDLNPEINYLGIDSNEFLLDKANKNYAQKNKIEFRNVDIYDDWGLKKKYDLVVAFGIVHHLIDNRSRTIFFERIKNAVKENGFVVVTFWDFLSEPKLAKKIISQEKFTSIQVDGKNRLTKILNNLEVNDYILDWKRGQIAYRFAHYYTDKEIKQLANSAELKIIEKFVADGSNKQANKYYIFSL